MPASRALPATAEGTGCAVCETLRDGFGTDVTEGCIVSGDGNGPLVLPGNGPLFTAGDDDKGPLFIIGDGVSAPLV